jgi:hypothetical protein
MLRAGVEKLSSICEILGPIPSTTKNKTKPNPEGKEKNQNFRVYIHGDISPINNCFVTSLSGFGIRGIPALLFSGRLCDIILSFFGGTDV